MTDVTTDTQWEAYTQLFTQYLNRTENISRIQDMLNNNKTRFTINLDNLRMTYPLLVPVLLTKPIQCLRILEGVLQNIIDGLNYDSSSNKKRQQGNVMQKRPHYTFAFEGNFGKNHITPRGLNSSTIHNLVAVNGIVTRMSIVRPKLVHSVHYCEATKIGTVKEYYDQYSVTADKTLQGQSNAFPRKDDHDNPLTTEYGFCKYKDYQTLIVQEMPEKAPTGMMPHSVEVVLEEDLVDKVKPGDRVQVVGVFKAITSQNTSMNAIFRGVLIATNINALATEVDTPTLSPDDVRNIKKLSERKDIFDLLSRSVAPSIYGHENIKKAILLMLLGGVEKVLENKAHLRGDINILMIGDPSTAKSQLLRRVLSIAPLAVNTTGRGSSGVGLTAAVTLDKDTGEKHLEAGAMVLADRGIVCIDEFDKMEENDRVAIHEVMEQQTVTIAKAGIHTTLNARCSVVAAANPIYGEYQKDLPPTKNIGLPDSLLSRFDFIFIVLDEKNSEIDRLIAERVTRNHRYITPGQEDNFALFDHTDDYIIEPEIHEKSDNEIFEKYNATIHDPNSGEILTQKFLKKYIYFAKKTITPVMKDEAVDFISNAWTQMRQREQEDTNNNAPKTMSITIRTLETLIRVATAHAKMRLSKEVETIDCEVAYELLNYALFNERHRGDDDSEDGGNDSDDGNDDFRPKSKGRLSTNKDTTTSNYGRETRSKTRKDQRDGSDKDNIKIEPEEEVQEITTTKTPHKLLKKKVEMANRKEDARREEPKKETVQEKDLTKRLKKLDIRDDVDDLLDRSIAHDIQVTEDAIKYVYKQFNELRGTRNQVPEAELWDHITKKVGSEPQNIKGSLQRREGLKKILEILDEKNKIMMKKDTKVIISLD